MHTNEYQKCYIGAIIPEAQVLRMRRQICLCVGVGLVFVTAATVCLGQTKPQFNTASAGVKVADIEAAVSLICKTKDIKRRKDGKVDGCRTCPEGTDFHGEGQSEWQMYAETPGHFTSAQDDNLILDGTGCDSHANNLGGSFVFKIVAGKARLVRYNPGLITDECHKFDFTDGRNYLICRGGWFGQGEADATVFMAIFDAIGKGVVSNLISVRDTTGTCGDSPQLVRESDIKEIEFSPADSAQITGLTITATFGNVRCSQVEAKSKKPMVKSYEIEYVFDGKRFKVTPASRAAFNRVSATE